MTAPERGSEYALPASLRSEETLEALRAGVDPLAPSFLAWIERLSACADESPLLVAQARRYRVEIHAVDRPRSGRYSLRVLLGHALGSASERSAWLDAYFANASALADQDAKLWEQRAARAGESGPSSEVAALAGDWLDSSRDLMPELGIRDLPSLIGSALGPEIAEGWPSRISARSIAELLREARWFDGLSLDPEPFPAALGAASFVRALAIVGRAWSEAAAPGRGFLVVNRLPESQLDHAHAELFAGLPLSPAFAQRRLGLGKARTADHLRGMARLFLLETRARALRVLVSGAALRGSAAFRDAFLEQSARAFGFELPPRAAGSLWRLRADDAERFAAPFVGAARARTLVDVHDEDWFRNPRAVEELRAEAASAETAVLRATIEQGQRALLRAIADAL